MRNNYGINHIMNRDGVYYYIKRVPCDLSDFYAFKRLCFSLKTKSLNTACNNAWSEAKACYSEAKRDNKKLAF